MMDNSVPLSGVEPCLDGVMGTAYTIITRQGHETIHAAVIHERLITFFVNGQEIVTVMSTPCQQEAHALGFLANEGVIDSLADIRATHVCPSGACVDVWLTRSGIELPRRLIMTSGCGGGVTFEDMSSAFPPLQSDLQATPAQLWELMGQLNRAARLYSQARGVHTSTLNDLEGPLLVAEDVGRHNTLDKLRGLALLQEVPTRDRIIVTSGRISSEMINKARRMQVPIVCSRTSPTSMSVALAHEWNITLIGYLRRNSMHLYTHPERILTHDRPPAVPTREWMREDTADVP